MDASATLSSGHIDWGHIDWGLVSLALSIPVGVLCGIASILLAPPLITYLEKRKLIKSNRSKEQELANYKRVEAFKNGTRDRYHTRSRSADFVGRIGDLHNSVGASKLERLGFSQPRVAPFGSCPSHLCHPVHGRYCGECQTHRAV